MFNIFVPTDRIPMIFMMTDGAVADERGIHQWIVQNPTRVRIHTMGIGDFSNAYFLKVLSFFLFSFYAYKALFRCWLWRGGALQITFRTQKTFSPRYWTWFGQLPLLFSLMLKYCYLYSRKSILTHPLFCDIFFDPSNLRSIPLSNSRFVLRQSTSKFHTTACDRVTSNISHKIVNIRQSCSTIWSRPRSRIPS